MSIALGMAFTTGQDTAVHIAFSALIFAGLLTVFGGRLIRNDLRQDMQHLPLIKSLPMAASDIVLAEVTSAVLPMAGAQLALLIISYVSFMFTPRHAISADVRLALIASAPFAVLAINGALITIQNAMAVLFPAWVRLGPVVTTGVEALGQNVLAMVANLFALGLGLIVPVIIAAALVRWGASNTSLTASLAKPSTIASVVIVASIVLALETYGAMRFLGRALARAEPLQTG